MNRKKLLISVASLIAVACLAVICFHFISKMSFSNNTTSVDDVITGDNWLTVSSVSKLQELAKKTDKTVKMEHESAYVSNLVFGDGEATYCYLIEDDEKIVGLHIGYMLVASTETDGKFTMEEITAQELSNRIKVVLGWISEALDVRIGDNFYIFSESGEMLSVEEESSYEQIINNTATLELRILDTDASVWVLNIENIPGYSMISCTFKHCLADSEEAQIPCNVAIEK